MNIIDKPQFSYRGLMLDVSRHFFTVEEIKKTLEIMSLYKLNTFHWHLTDDQGWRIEIEKYPLLTEIGSYRSETMVEKNFDPYVGDGVAHSGFYTQSEVKDIVAYANERFITVVPEIDLPGHMSAAIAAYPELGCNNDAINVPTYWGVFSNILCPKDKTFNFLEDVLLEVIALFPSKKIHLGGDEVPQWVWQKNEQTQDFIEKNVLAGESGLHHYFFQRMATFLVAQNRQAIGWDDLLGKGNLVNTSIMVWQNTNQLTLAAKQNVDVIMSPSEFSYFNYYQGDHDKEPLAQCCSLPIEKVYQLSAFIDGLSRAEQLRIIGIQANVWTEYIKNQAQLEYMLMPRMMALSEVAWTEPKNARWDLFEQNYIAHFAFINYFDIGSREKK
jgi:hexosaminidase